MVGQFGIISTKNNIDRQIINQIANHYKTYSWIEIKSLVGERYHINSSQRNFLPTGGQIFQNDSGSIVIDGEVYRKKGITKKYALCTAEDILNLYFLDGLSFVEKIKGTYSISIIDTTKDKLYVISDHYGLKPIFYCTKHNNFAWASHLTAITQFHSGAWLTINWNTVSDWLSYEHIIGDQTFFNEIELLTAGAILKVNLNDLRINKEIYWSPNSLIYKEDIKEKKAIEESCFYLKEAIEYLTHDEYLGVYLTSGLDSRSIAGYLKKAKKDFVSVTYGLPNTRDLVWGRHLAKLSSSKHYEFVFHDGNWLFENSNLFNKICGSFVSIFHSHGISIYPHINDELRVHISGYGGGSFAGGDTSKYNSRKLNLDEKVYMVDSHFRRLGSGFSKKEELLSLFQSKYRKKIEQVNGNSMRSEVEKFKYLPESMLMDVSILRNRYQKMYASMISVERTFFENRLPFMDYDFLQFVLTLPPHIKAKRNLQIAMLDKDMPIFTLVPWQTTANLPTHNYLPKKIYGASRKLKSILGINSIPKEPGRNYPYWLINFGLNWVSQKISNMYLIQEGVLNKQTIEELFNNITHMENLPYEEQRGLTYKMGVILSLNELLKENADKIILN